MLVEEQDLERMLLMQHIDLQRLQAEKKLADLPQRGKIVAIRQKKAAVLEKQEKIRAMQADARMKASRVSDEDEMLAAKAAAVQDAIDKAKGDYRSVESRTKELSGISKRRATLAEDHDALVAELDQANALAAQVDAALEQLDHAEQKQVASFRQEGGALQTQIARLKAERARYAASLPDEVSALYEKTAAKCAGVAIGRLEDGTKCSVCRTVLDDAHALSVRSEKPLGTCPACHRLLIVQ